MDEKTLEEGAEAGTRKARRCLLFYEDVGFSIVEPVTIMSHLLEN